MPNSTTRRKIPSRVPPAQQPETKPAAKALVAPPDTVMRTLPSAAHLSRGLDGLNAILVTLAGELAASSKKGAINVARSFVALHYIKTRLEEIDKAFGAVFSEYQKQKIPELFQQEGVTSVPLEEGYRVGVSSKFLASILPDKKKEAYDWLKDNGLESLITPTVNASTLSAALKNMLEEHNKEAPELYFNVAYVPNTSVTKTT